MVIDGVGSFKTVQDVLDVSSGDGGSGMQKTGDTASLQALKCLYGGLVGVKFQQAT